MFTSKEIRSIAEAGEYDMDKCVKAFEVYQKTDKSTIDNPIGFIIQAIKCGWVTGKKPNKFNQYPQNEYDFEELEKALIQNN